ncbi:hypothetical protein LUW76_21725 [Actinomadura madurae]|uniref:hypothetical protein n=1 Tax=Actinomadura madurae TaxID=1993 RepID=UPI0020268C2F|nr:hypothetical protein [Actinomadura madurae]URM96749.1 hypothetical protein LUW76_21725 [Actinomadura madurae]URN07435.1 hypothetical protein LUW74_31550 [Actinomadura madurae]
MAPHRYGWKTIRAENIVGCTAGLLRFATPAEMDVLIGMLPAEHVRQAARSHGMANRVVLEALLRRGGPGDLDLLVQHALRPGDPPSLLGRLLDLDDPEVNATLLDAVTALGGVPRNLRRQLAHQTSRRDGATPRPLPAATRQDLLSGLGGSGALDHAMLYSADPDMAGTALWFLGAGADPHGAVQACRTLLDAHRGHEIRQLVEQGRLPAFQWGPDGSLPSVLAYAQAALESGQGEWRLRDLSDQARKAEFLRSVAEIADAAGCEPWRGRPLVRTVVHRRHPGVPRVGWDDVLADERRRRAKEGPIPRRAARFMAKRTDTPLELQRTVVADHPDLAALICDPSPVLLADLCGQEARPGSDVLVKVAGNGLVAGTLTAEFVVATVPDEALADVAESLWLPGLRGTARIRARLGLDGDVPLAPLFVDETGDGRARRLREPGTRRHWDPEPIYGTYAARVLREVEDPTADLVLSVAEVDRLLAPADGAFPDPRVLRRLAEHVDRHLGGRPDAWRVALKLLGEGFAGALPELIATAGAVTS